MLRPQTGFSSKKSGNRQPTRQLTLTDNAAGKQEKTTNTQQMTIKIRRQEIQIETHEVTIIRGPGAQHTTYCENCQSSVTGFTLDQAAAFLLKSTIQASIDRGDFHLVNESLVCSNSLDKPKNNLLAIK